MHRLNVRGLTSIPFDVINRVASHWTGHVQSLPGHSRNFRHGSNMWVTYYIINRSKLYFYQLFKIIIMVVVFLEYLTVNI